MDETEQKLKEEVERDERENPLIKKWRDYERECIMWEKGKTFPNLPFPPKLIVRRIHCYFDEPELFAVAMRNFHAYLETKPYVGGTLYMPTLLKGKPPKPPKVTKKPRPMGRPRSKPIIIKEKTYREIVQLTLDELTALQKYSQEQGVSVSEAAAKLIGAGLGVERKPPTIIEPPPREPESTEVVEVEWRPFKVWAEAAREAREEEGRKLES